MLLFHIEFMEQFIWVVECDRDTWIWYPIAYF